MNIMTGREICLFAIMKNIEEKISKVKSKLMIQNPYFGTLASSLKFEKNHYFKNAIQLRKFDESAKKENLKIKKIEDYILKTRPYLYSIKDINFSAPHFSRFILKSSFGKLSPAILTTLDIKKQKKNRTKIFSITLPLDLYEQVDTDAKSESISKNAMIIRALKHFYNL